jgi:hypothetical protein
MPLIDPSKLIFALANSLTANEHHWDKYIRAHNLEASVDIILEYLTAIKMRRTYPSSGFYSRSSDCDVITFDLGLNKKRFTRENEIESEKNSDEHLYEDQHPKNTIITKELPMEKQTYQRTTFGTELAPAIEFVSEEKYTPYKGKIRKTIPGVKKLRKPSCFEKFNIENFIEFVNLRSLLDSYMSQLPIDVSGFPVGSICESRVVAMCETLKSQKLFKNKHIIAYFYNKLSLYVSEYQSRLRILKNIFLDFSIKGKSVSSLKTWGEIVDHNSNLQWFAGVSSEEMAISSALNWKTRLDNYEGPEIFIKIIMGDSAYFVPSS